MNHTIDLRVDHEIEQDSVASLASKNKIISENLRSSNFENSKNYLANNLQSIINNNDTYRGATSRMDSNENI